MSETPAELRASAKAHNEEAVRSFREGEETPEMWRSFLELMLSTWDRCEMAYMHLTVMGDDYDYESQ